MMCYLPKSTLFSLSLALSFILMGPLGVWGQSEIAVTDTCCPERDLADIAREALNRPAKPKTAGEGTLILLPIIGSNPATGFMVGAGGQYAFKMPSSTRYSLIMGSLQYTTKNQFIAMLKNNIYSKYNRLFMSGDWRFLIFSQNTYGIGTKAPEGGVMDYQYSLMGMETSQDSLAQPMSFNFALLHQSIGFKVADEIYLGFGYQFDSYFNIKDKLLRLEPGDTLYTSHYLYNKRNRFNLQSYYNSAINANFVIDKRDNMIRAFKGYYLMLNWRGGFKFIGNDPACIHGHSVHAGRRQ